MAESTPSYKIKKGIPMISTSFCSSDEQELTWSQSGPEFKPRTEDLAPSRSRRMLRAQVSAYCFVVLCGNIDHCFQGYFILDTGSYVLCRPPLGSGEPENDIVVLCYPSR